MRLAMVGLGRMGGNMVKRLEGDGHELASYAPSGGGTADSLEELVGQLEAPRVVWLMIPAGAPTEEAFGQLLGLLDEGDVIVDGGNSHYVTTKERAARCAGAGVTLVDCGTSGGIWGYENGYCLMVGGPEAAVKQVEPAFLTLAPPDGYLHVGPVAAGHFVKMVHNGIEYGMMQAIGEGFEVLARSEFRDFDLAGIAELWQHSSVVRSWLVELAGLAFREDARLDKIDDYVEDSGEGRWTILEAMNQDTPTPVITLSLLARFASRQESSFSAKVVAALRKQFGGHAVKSAD